MPALSHRARRTYLERRRAGDPAHLAYYRARLEDHPLVPADEWDYHAPDDVAAAYTCEVDGRTYRIELHHDLDAWQLYGDDCYSPEDLEAAARDAWSFYGVVVVLPGVGGEGRASVWGCEVGPYWPGTDEAQVWDHVTNNDLLGQALADLLSTSTDVSAELAAPLEASA